MANTYLDDAALQYFWQKCISLYSKGFTVTDPDYGRLLAEATYTMTGGRLVLKSTNLADPTASTITNLILDNSGITFDREGVTIHPVVVSTW